MTDTRGGGPQGTDLRTQSRYGDATPTASSARSLTTSAVADVRQTVRASRTDGSVNVRLVPFTVKTEKPNTSG